MNTTWKDREPAIKELVPDLLRDLVVLEQQAPVTVRVFFCEGVMAIVKYLREATHAKDIGATHHVFKILGKHAMYGERGRLEFSDKGERMDIYFEDTMVSISVKALVMATIKAIRGTTMAVFDAAPVDRIWIFFFYKFKDRASPRPPCRIGGAHHWTPPFQEPGGHVSTHRARAPRTRLASPRSRSSRSSRLPIQRRDQFS